MIKNASIILSGILAFFVSTIFAIMVFQQNVPQNIATWVMIFSLDALGVVLVIKDGNEKPYIQIGWALSAFFILIAAVFNKSTMHWGLVETICMMLCVAAVYVWFKASARIAMFPYIFAAYVSIAPLAVQYWYKPDPDTLWFWPGHVVACLLAIYGAPKRDFTNTFVPWNGVIINVAITILCML